MKKLLQILLLLVAITSINAQQKSKITEVTVYLDGAEVNRKTTVNLKSGSSTFTFKGLSPYIEESSIQISGLKKASILSINYGINYLSKQKQNDSVLVLQDELKIIDITIQNQYTLIAGYNEELSLLQNNKRLGNETEVVSLDKLKTFATYFRTRITELNLAINAANDQIIAQQEKQRDIKQQLTEFNVDEKVQTGEIKLKLNSAIATDLDLKLTYNIKNAGWFPIYDLKAEKINSPITLEYKAHVFQNSGCDWDDVNLVLSTSDPNTNNEKPIVNPKYLNFISAYSNYQTQNATRSYNYKYNPLVKTVSGIVTTASDGLPLPGASVIEKGTSNGAQTDFDGRYTLKTTNGNTLVYNYVGMNSEELPIHSSTMNVSLNQGNRLDEVVVVGYGTTTKATYESSPYKNKVQAMIDNGNDFDDDYESDIQPINYTSNGNIIESGIMSTRFEIDEKYTIPSDGDVTVIEIDKFNVPATYDYFAAPVLNENVFLTAKIGNWEQYNLLPAEANVYFEGSYSGKTNINPGAVSDSLTISLGVDPNIIVKRTQLKDFKKTTFIGSNKIVYKGFDIDVKNNKPSHVRLTLVDRIPITQNKAIKLDDINTGTSNYDEENGLLKWILNLKSGASIKVKHSYAIKYPKGKRINL
ncbi:DUF4139 domain-containing protein [uncultured Winogradskyella sp.]|uniref:DUF4139 domain-containing protein n=1 Tax=uncultured Winogradskyella sp. TaxID=395353 RepID=UPI0030DC00BD|tara:strand:- start:43132 stop:45057 length:1926 start_codon:yes stop_codon:yes gene_type:complete